MLPLLLGLAGAAAGIASGVGSYLVNSSANDRAKLLQDRALQQWMQLNIPSIEEQQVVFDQFVNQGTLDPRLEGAIKSDPSAFEKVFASAKNTAAQGRALSELEEIGHSGGMRLQDKAALQDATLENTARDRAGRDAISSEMARRGMGGSGFDVAARLSNQQATSDRNANASLKTAAMAEDRALQAIQGAGDLATKYRGQEFGEQAQKATAADKIAMFNTDNLRDVQQRNVGSLNRSAEMNLANRQDIANKNVQLKNQQSLYNKGLIQQDYENRAKKTAGATGQYQNLAQTEQKGGEIAGNAISNIGGSVSNAATAGANASFWDDYFKNQQKKKLQLEPGAEIA